MVKFRVIVLAVFCLPMSLRAQHAKDSLSIYFEFGKADIKATYKKTLDSFARKIPEGYVFYINGYADHPGGDSLNLIVSKKRAENVAACLVSNGMSEDRIIKSTGMGAVRSGSADPNSAFRRVDIIIDKPRSIFNKLAMIPLNGVIELRDILFSTGSHRLQNLKLISFVDVYGAKYQPIYRSDTSIHQLDTIAMYLVAHPTIKVRMEGHVCCYEDSYEKVHGFADLWDNDAQNYKLSENRAKAVVDYLIKKGVDSSRLSYIGYAFTRPKRYPENMPVDMDQNRRVEMRIMEK